MNLLRRWIPVLLVRVRSRPTHPMSTTRSSLISFGSVAPPYPISSCVEKQIYVLCFGFMSLSFMIFKSVSSSAEQALSSMKRDFKNPLFRKCCLRVVAYEISCMNSERFYIFFRVNNLIDTNGHVLLISVSCRCIREYVNCR